jgi:hypothetical protein
MKPQYLDLNTGNSNCNFRELLRLNCLTEQLRLIDGCYSIRSERNLLTQLPSIYDHPKHQISESIGFDSELECLQQGQNNDI